LTYLRFTPSEFVAMTALCQALELGRLSLTAFGCLLSFELTDAQPHLARRIDALSTGGLRLLRERLPGRPATEFTAAEVRKLTEACGLLPRGGRFARPHRRRLVARLTKARPGLARKIAHLNDDEFERLCQQIRGQEEAGA
jgi:hypothetical protein